MAKPRTKRQDHLGPLVHPTVRFFWGLVLIGCLVFAGTWEARSLLAVGGAALAVTAGKRVNLGYFAFLVATVVIFNLLLPVGKVWFSIGPFPITEGAFFQGLGKGMTFAGLVLLSLGTISRDLALPGKFGALWAKTFSWYEQLMDQRGAIKPRALLMSIDRLLENLYPTRPGSTVQTPEPGRESSTPRATTKGGWILVGLTAAAALALSVLWR